jgi:hypothetical protein
VRRSAVGQIALVILTWIYIVALHWRNDGLWFQGDAPRHAANGLFWWDFLSRIPVNPFEFALTYYARYPVINPPMYPPVFYLLEGATFAVFGPSPFVAKALVLCFTLAVGLYMLAWLRRWMLPAAGWAAPLLILQPSVIGWSHAVMLNVPAMALTFAALYHGRRWLEAPASRQIYLTVTFTVLAVLTYVTSGLLVFVLLAWAAFEHRWTAIVTRRAIAVWIAGGLVVLPWAIIVVTWMRPVAEFTVARPGATLSTRAWLYYVHALPHLFAPLLLGAAAVGAVGALLDTRWRHEAIVASLWATLCYIGLCYIGPREDRYLLIAAPAVVIVGVLGVVLLVGWIPVVRIIDKTGIIATAALILVAVHLVRAHSMFLPFVEGFPDVVRYFEREAPHERVLYDGPFNGSFSFYMRAGDPGFTRSVVAGHKLLYPSAMMRAGGRVTERASSPAQALAILRGECDCRWVVIERSRGSEATLAARHLREAVAGPEFQFMTSYTLRGNTPIRLDIYRLIEGQTGRGDVDVRLPILRPDAEFRRRPIER